MPRPSLAYSKTSYTFQVSHEEVCEEDPKEKRERSPCGILESSERKLEARKEKRQKDVISMRRKQQADPYAEESTEMEDEDTLDIATECNRKAAEKIKNECKTCGHANRSVNFGLVKRYTKSSLPLGQCVHCRKGRIFTEIVSGDSNLNTHVPVIWLCAFCGYQGCDRNSPGKHAFHHYKMPRSDSHCIVINTQVWTVWCYECDSEILHTSSKKLHDVIQYVKRLSESSPMKRVMQQLEVERPTNLLTQYCGSESRLHSRSKYEEICKKVKLRKNTLASIPKVKGISNLGNTCFFNSVIQSLSQTLYLTQMLNKHLQSGERLVLPGRPVENSEEKTNKTREKTKRFGSLSKDDEDDAKEEDTMELKPLELYLPDGGPLSSAFNVFLKDMHSNSKSDVLNPGHFFGQISKKNTQFQGYEQQDAHELLRCFLEAVKTEEIVRAKRAILKAFALSEKIDPNTVGVRLKKTVKAYGQQVTHTIIDQIFGGHLISTVFCEECHTSSQVFEPFMDLSLPINEEKGKPRKGSSEDEVLGDALGLSNGHAFVGLSKYRQKKLRKGERKQNRKNRRRNSGGGGAGSGSCLRTSACIQISIEERDEECGDREEIRRIRLTEKRRPEDEEEYRVKEEEKKRMHDERILISPKRKGESSRFKQLTQARGSKKGGSEDASGDHDESDEELEYDHDEDEEEAEDYSLLSFIRKDDHDDISLPYNKFRNNSKNCQTGDINDSEGEDSDEDDSGGEETEENEDSDSDVYSSARNSRCKKTSRETSDADVEDNTDSEYVRNSFCNNTRQPSIVIDTSSEPLPEPVIPERDNRFLKTGNCLDYYNDNSCSDTSERYFTAAGADTPDELDSCADACGHNCKTRGRGHRVDKGDVHLGRLKRNDVEEITYRFGEMRMHRKSSSRESLLDGPPRGGKRGSLEAIHHSSTSMEKLDEEDSQLRKSLYMKKLKQEWLCRSITTISPKYQSERQECSVLSSLANFTAPELLTGNNKISCENCLRLESERCEEASEAPRKSNANKQLLILSPPAVLTLHLKRFHHVGHNLTKVNRHVSFPLVLDLAPFTSSSASGLPNMSRGQSSIFYCLYAVVQHSGRMNSGHYVAFVRARHGGTANRFFLNSKLSSDFEVNRLITEEVDRLESAHSSSNEGSRPLNIDRVEADVRSGRWYNVSDTYVTEVTVEKVLKAQAYLLFYERVL